MPGLFAGTMFCSALLLFCVQPMVAKLILPLLGGTPAVWTTCMVFFQAVLLGGYLYAHLLTERFRPLVQVVIHMALLVAVLASLPIHLPADLVANVPRSGNPAGWELWLLARAVGLPFFALSATAPLLQRWLGNTRARDAADPYYLYAASNLGSMIGLLGYPFLVEPLWSLTDQRFHWSIGVSAFALATGTCGVLALLYRQQIDEPPDASSETASAPPAKLGFVRRLRWVGLAFIPSSLLLGVTTYITTDVAAIPLLWVVPLALYLLTFILVFARRQLVPHRWLLRLLPPLALILIMALAGNFGLSQWATVPLHWLALFVVAMVCHGELALDRPPVQQLTEFYLWMSVGGVLGGSFNALVAPMLFQGGIFEYPLALVLACLARPRPLAATKGNGASRWLDFALPMGLSLLVVGLAAARQTLPRDYQYAALIVLLGGAGMLCFSWVERPVRFALGLGAVLLGVGMVDETSRNRFSERNFFGVVRVRDSEDGRTRILFHGTTIHGLQRLGSDGQLVRPPEPLGYYHRTGPVGQVFRIFAERTAGGSAVPRVAAIGLGVGAISAYATPDQDWTFFEIDPAVRRVAEDTRYFTFLADQRAHALTIEDGDAKLRLEDHPDGSFGLLVVDAFSSDSVPAHLICREAVELYQKKLAPGGILAFHVSNRYLNLKPILAALADDATPKLVCYAGDDTRLEEADWEAGKSPSEWVVLAAHDTDLGGIAHDPRWVQLHRTPRDPLWTQDFSNLFSVLRWR